MLNAYGQSQDFFNSSALGPGNDPFMMKSKEVSNREGGYQQGFNGFRGARTATADN